MKKVILPVASCLLAICFVSCKKDLPTNVAGQNTSGAPVATNDSTPKAAPVPGATAGTASSNVNDSTTKKIVVPGGTAAASGSNAPISAIKPVGSHLPFITGENIDMKPVKIFSGKDVTGIQFSAATEGSYVGYSCSIFSTMQQSGSNYQFNFIDVLQAPGGFYTNLPATGQYTLNFDTDVNSNFTINFNGVTYTGTIVKTGNSINIVWPYSTGIIISPTSL